MTAIYDTCPECGSAISQLPGRGKARKYCGQACQIKANDKKQASRLYAACSVDGCDRPAVRVGAQMCEVHYYRARRSGTTALVGHALPGNLVHTGGYLMQPAQGHPRALGGYRAYQHRVVFTDAHGEGPFKCHWCDVAVTWNDMHVDHVDADPKNNDITNLVASCALCNQKRGHERIRSTMRAKHGYTIQGVTRTLNEWAAQYQISRSSIVARINAGWTVESAITEPRGKFGPKRTERREGGGKV